MPSHSDSIGNKTPRNFLGFVFLAVLAVIVFINFKNLLPKLSNQSKSADTEVKHRLLAYGMNSFGQLGKPPYELSEGKNAVDFGGSIKDVFVGRNYSMILSDAGVVYVWGGNDWGQLGRETAGTYYDPNLAKLPIENIAKLSSTNNHTLALTNDGKVYSFGSNFSGQLGTGDNVDRNTPYLVEGVLGVSDIAAGYKFSVAVFKDGSVWGWGASCATDAKSQAEAWWKTLVGSIDNIDGGYYDSTSDSLAFYDKNEYCINEEVVGIMSKTPVKIEGTENIVQISAGYGHALALSENGDVWSFGCNTYKQLGRITEEKSENQTLTKIEGLEGIASVTAGYRHSFALAKDGTLWAWGLNNHGQLGVTTDEVLQVQPIKVPVDNVVQIIAGYDYSIAVKADGTVWGWGINRQKWFENSDKEFVDTPVQLTEFKNVKKIAASGGHMLILSN